MTSLNCRPSGRTEKDAFDELTVDGPVAACALLGGNAPKHARARAVAPRPALEAI